MAMNLGVGIWRFVGAGLLGAMGSLVNASPGSADGKQVTPLSPGSSDLRTLRDVEEGLKQRPQDRQLLLSKGLLLMESSTRTDALRFHEQLVKEHPDFWEAYNNLAYLQAAAGEWVKARETLEKGLRSQPGYYTLVANLTRIHASEASVAYRRALQVGGGDTDHLQLNLIKPDRSALTLAVPKTAPQSAPKTAETAMSIPAEKTAPPRPEVKPAVPVSAAASGSSGAVSRPVSADGGPNQEKAVQQAVLRWARAWSDKDFKRYLQSYDTEFSPPEKMSRREWERERESRIVKRKRIEVKLNGLEVQLKGQRAVVTFRQSYSSDGVKAVTRKRLELVWRGGEWRILKEQA